MPEQRDPLDQLSQFGAGFSTGASGGPMPHSAADARRRGEKIRRRRNALVAGGAALAVAAVAVPIFAIAGGSGTDDRDDTNVADPPRSVALSADDLLADGETAHNNWGDWQETETFEGDGQATTFSCQQQALSGLGSTAEFNRFFGFAPGGEIVDEPYPPTLAQEVAEFPDAEAAQAAFATISGWLDDCASLGEATEIRTLQSRPVDIVGGQGLIVDIHGNPAPVEVDPYGDSAYINETGVVLLDDRIAVLSLTQISQDYNFLEETGGTPMQRMLPLAAERLAPGANVPEVPESVSDPDAATGDTVIDDAFPLAAGWPDRTAEPDQDGLVGPDRERDPVAFEACGTPLADAPFNDRLGATWSDVEDYRTRQLTTYQSVAEAEAAIAAVADLYRGCPEGETREDGYTPNWSVRSVGDVGHEAVAILGWDEFEGSPTTFGDTTVLVRVGNAVLVAAWGGHAGNPQGREDEIVAEIVAETTTVLDAMCAFDAQGC
ncbi:hypothetical protein ACFQ0K_04320 [Nocardioides caeni]|uniref:PknH-like extracellular domain-containing protein n=1 Tax=Nocardioides caeni TaxID=574700 RepID=A0A4S8N568_9ACTN|nr:hypothetical protein [Nocardioides caeni]THV10741.1 hypothetical protein E9934_13450 [Nocardioides caeni]